MTEKLDDLDRQLLNIIQSGFPLVSRPYQQLAEKIGISEEEAFARITAMRKSGLIRRLGANFQSSELGFVSTLCAARVPSEVLDNFIALVNEIPGVTHNYERKHEYNIWFTLISRSASEAQSILDMITEKTGIAILNLPATRLYKIKVDFQME